MLHSFLQGHALFRWGLWKSTDCQLWGTISFLTPVRSYSSRSVRWFGIFATQYFDVHYVLSAVPKTPCFFEDFPSKDPTFCQIPPKDLWFFFFPLKYPIFTILWPKRQQFSSVQLLRRRNICPRNTLFSVSAPKDPHGDRTHVSLYYIRVPPQPPTPESGPLDLSRISAYASRSTHYI